ncbi:MAG: mevalonate kinase, partial [Crenarchaeota archaeon]|nr:mevalonate kinase [Thermoproteota archaeon]
MIVSKAPLVLKLAGEHAVVYGRTALACAIDRYVKVTLREREDGKIVFKFRDMVEEYRRDRSSSFFRYVNECIRLIEELLGERLRGLDVSIEMSRDVLPGAGLGTSAATCVATVAALCRYLNVKYDIAELAYNVELRVQRRASRMDTYTSSLGGVTIVRRGAVEKVELDHSWLRMGIVLLRKLKSTRELVRHVSELREREPKIVERIFDLIEEISLEILDALRVRDVDKLGKLVTRCHWLLNMLDVVDYRSNRIVIELLNSTNVAGAKISGAGYGGAILFILRSNL